MAALNFPLSPTHLDLYTDPNQAVWQYDSDYTYWNVITSTTRKNFSGVKVQPQIDNSLSSSYSVINFDTREFDVDGYTTSSAGVFKAPTTGFYRVSIILYSSPQGSGSSYTVQVIKNGSNVLETSTMGPNQSISYDESLSLVAGDTIQVKAKEAASVGSILNESKFTFYRLGFAPGTGISNHNAFSGVRVNVSADINTTSTPTAITWGSTAFNANANVNGDLFWFSSDADRVTVRTSGFYKIRSFVQSGADGSSNSYTITLRKNGATAVDTISMSANDFVDLDVILELAEDDFLELLISNSDNTGTILSNTYLELVREGV